MRRPFMSRIPKITNREDGKDLVKPKQLRLDHAEIVLKQAEEQVKRGTLSHDAPRSARRRRMEEAMGSPAHFPGGSNSPHYDTDERRPNRGPLMPTPRPENDFVEGQNMRSPQRLPNNGPRFEQDSSMGFRGDVRFPPK